MNNQAMNRDAGSLQDLDKLFPLFGVHFLLSKRSEIQLVLALFCLWKYFLTYHFTDGRVKTWRHAVQSRNWYSGFLDCFHQLRVFSKSPAAFSSETHSAIPWHLVSLYQNGT